MRINFALGWYLASIYALLFAVLFLISTTFPRTVSNPLRTEYRMYKALPTTSDLNSQIVTINKKDGREIIISNFLNQRKSPLAPFAYKFIEVADHYNFDYRLLPAIAMQESNGGKIIPNDSFNPFGYGIYGKSVLKFSSFEEAIEKVGKGLKRDYIDQGLIKPEQIMTKYTPPSLAKGGAWAIGVSSFMQDLH